jgi:hypothetical protein
MERFMVTLSDDEVVVLRRLAYERRTPMAKLIREAIDAQYGTSDAEIPPPGRPKGSAP